MNIKWNNKEEVNKIYIHDSIFVGYIYNYEKRVIKLSCKNPFRKKNYHLTFHNVIFINMQSCSYWCEGNNILGIYLNEECNLIQQQKCSQDSYQGSRLHRGINYLEIAIDINSGDELLIVCESINFIEENI